MGSGLDQNRLITFMQGDTAGRSGLAAGWAGGSLLMSYRSLSAPSAFWAAGDCIPSLEAACLQTSYKLLSSGGTASDALAGLDCCTGKVKSSYSSSISFKLRISELASSTASSQPGSTTERRHVCPAPCGLWHMVACFGHRGVS